MSKKEAIMDAAARLFSTKGFNETRLSEIANMTGAAEGTVIYHFKSKEGLFLSILKAFKDSIVSELKKYTRDREFENGLKMAGDLITFYLQLADSMEEQFLLLHRHDAYQLALTREECREDMEAIYDCLVDVFEQAIELGQKDGSILDMPARKMAMIIFSMVDGLLRLNTYGLYDAGTLYNELIFACNRILAADSNSYVKGAP